MHGKGKFTVSKTGVIYAGEFDHGSFHRGLISYPNGDEYSGEVKDGTRHDRQGRYAYRNIRIDEIYRSGYLPKPGDRVVRYVGGWRNDIKHD